MKKNRLEKDKFIAIGAGLVVAIIYLHLQANTIYGGDAGDLAAAIATVGIPHPPGYPLYTLVGVLITKVISFGTLAWKVAFLSSLPSIFCSLILFELLRLLNKKILPSLISVFTFAFLYPVWLYSEVVEVFALNNFFILLLLWLFYHFYISGKIRYLYFGAFVFGLSLAHHHIILFLVPALLYLFWFKKKNLDKKTYFFSFIFFSIGLIPYLYSIVASYNYPAVNWMGDPNWDNFIKLVTRAGYGTFTSNALIIHHPLVRFLDLWAFFNFVYKDFRVLGCFLLLIGAVSFLKLKQRKKYTAIIIAIISYLFFIFYSSFSLASNFNVGTFERFVQPLYLLFVFLLCRGLILIETAIGKFIALKFAFQKARILSRVFMLMFFIYPLGLFILNYPKISILKNDFTAENLAKDILDNIPSDSLLIIATDTPLFNTQYVYFSEKKWPNIKLVSFTQLFNPNYSQILKKYYPELIPISSIDDDKKRYQDFLSQNYKLFPIYSKFSFKMENGKWIPFGLLFRYYPETEVLEKEAIYQENERLWSIYKDPLSGSLSTYQNLMLSDILRIYSIARQETANWEIEHGYAKEAEKHLLQARALTPSDLDINILLAKSYLFTKQCQKAQDQLDYVKKKDEQRDEEVLLLTIENYRFCFQDESKASFFQQLYEKARYEKETPLKKLPASYK